MTVSSVEAKRWPGGHGHWILCAGHWISATGLFGARQLKPKIFWFKGENVDENVPNIPRFR